MTFQKTSAFSLTAAVAIAVAGSAGGVAAAKEVTVVAQQTPDNALSYRVRYADLDLASPTGVERLNFRVRGAVRLVCAPFDQTNSFGEHAACRSFARNGARPQVDRAIARAREMAQFGSSSIAPVAIVIAAPQG